MNTGNYSVVDLLDDFVFGPLNLIDRAQGIYMQVKTGQRAVKFSILRMDKGGNHSRPEMRDMLHKYRVRTYGITHDATYLHVLIGKRQAKFAAYLLACAGIEYENGVRNKTPIKPGTPMPKPWSEK